METINNIHSLLPGEDCGLCQASSCKVFARKLNAGEDFPDRCPYLRMEKYSKAMAKINELQGKNKTFDPKIHEHTSELKPCTMDPSATMFEIQLTTGSKYPYFDIELLESNILTCKEFSAIKVSDGFGSLSFQYKGKEMLAYENGKVTIKRAKSKEDAIDTFNSFSKILWISRICPECASPAVDCAAGACIECADDACPVIDQGPKKIGRKEKEQYDGPEFELALKKTRQLQEAVLRQEALTPFLDECRTANIQLLNKSTDKEAGVAFIFYGFSRNLERISRTELTPQVKAIVKETIEAFNTADTERALKAVKNFEWAFKVNPSSQEEVLETLRVENNCRYLSRILMRAGQF